MRFPTMLYVRPAKPQMQRLIIFLIGHMKLLIIFLFSLAGTTSDYYNHSVPYSQYQSNIYPDANWAASAVRYGAAGGILSKLISLLL